MSGVLELLTGLGLSTSAGLNAWIPLLAVGLLARFTPVLTLPPGWEWLSDEWVLGILAVLLVVELVADKVPALDTANDVLQTVIRPSSGGLVAGVGTSAQTLTVADPTGVFSDHGWVPVTIGVVVALVVHLAKAGVRVALNSVTLGLSAPVLSLTEDLTSTVLSLVAILLPVLVIVCLVGLVWGGWRMVRRVRRRRVTRYRAT